MLASRAVPATERSQICIIPSGCILHIYWVFRKCGRLQCLTTDQLVNGITPPTRRDLFGVPSFDEEDGVIIAQEINSTRLPTAEEMQQYLGYTKCESGDCKNEIEENKRRFDELTSAIYAQTQISRAESSLSS